MHSDEILEHLLNALLQLRSMRDELESEVQYMILEPLQQETTARYYSIMITDLEKLIACYQAFNVNNIPF